MVEINPVDLAPGDAVGLCGLGTLGSNGHIMLFKHWTETGLAIAEQAGGRDGPIHRTLKRIPSGYLAYRYVGTLEGEDMTPDEAYVQHVINYRTEATIAMRDPIRIPEFESGGKFWGELVEANALARAVRAVAGGGVSAEDVANELAKRLAS